MAKNKKNPKSAPAPKSDDSQAKDRPPSRENSRYVDITAPLREAIEKLIEEDPRFEERTVPWVVQRAIKKFLAEHGRQPGPGKANQSD
jgi:hypothetical protein